MGKNGSGGLWLYEINLEKVMEDDLEEPPSQTCLTDLNHLYFSGIAECAGVNAQLNLQMIFFLSINFNTQDDSDEVSNAEKTLHITNVQQTHAHNENKKKSIHLTHLQ